MHAYTLFAYTLAVLATSTPAQASLVGEIAEMVGAHVPIQSSRTFDTFQGTVNKTSGPDSPIAVYVIQRATPKKRKRLDLARLAARLNVERAKLRDGVSLVKQHLDGLAPKLAALDDNVNIKDGIGQIKSKVEAVLSGILDTGGLLGGADGGKPALPDALHLDMTLIQSTIDKVMGGLGAASGKGGDKGKAADDVVVGLGQMKNKLASLMDCVKGSNNDISASSSSTQKATTTAAAAVAPSSSAKATTTPAAIAPSSSSAKATTTPAAASSSAKTTTTTSSTKTTTTSPAATSTSKSDSQSLADLLKASLSGLKLW